MSNRTDPQRQTAEQATALADYLLAWLRARNGAELAPALDDQTVGSARTMRGELISILIYGERPPNWVKP